MPPCIIGSFANDIVAVESGLGGCVADRCETPDLGKKDDDTAAEFCERKGARKQMTATCALSGLLFSRTLKDKTGEGVQNI